MCIRDSNDSVRGCERQQVLRMQDVEITHKLLLRPLCLKQPSQRLMGVYIHSWVYVAVHNTFLLKTKMKIPSKNISKNNSGQL